VQFYRAFTFVWFVNCCAGAALAQGVTPPNALSDQEKSAVGAILDSLTTKSGDDLKNSVVRELDGVSNNPKGAESVVTAVKIGAGPKLPVFQDILVSKCLGAGGAYCRMAALPGPQTESSDIQTSSTGAAGGGGGGGATGGAGGGGSGGPQTNFSHNSQTYAGLGASLSFNSSPQQFSFTGPSVSSSSSGTVVSSVTPSLAAPGPQAGAGLVSTLLTIAVLFWNARPSKRSEADLEGRQ
jgi:hypothetical protein